MEIKPATDEQIATMRDYLPAIGDTPITPKTACALIARIDALKAENEKLRDLNAIRMAEVVLYRDREPNDAAGILSQSSVAKRADYSDLLQTMSENTTCIKEVAYYIKELRVFMDAELEVSKKRAAIDAAGKDKP